MGTLQKISFLVILLSFLSCGRKVEPDEIVLNEMVVEKNGKYYYGDCEEHATEYYTGSDKYYYESGKVKGTFTIKNGFPDGHWEQFNEDGSKKLEIFFKDGKVTQRLVYCVGD